MNAPSKIWICKKDREAPDWVLERMTTADIADDGSFEIEASDGVVRVEPDFAVFVFGDQVFACLPKLVPDKIKAAESPSPQAPAIAPPPKRQDRATASDKPLKLKPMIGSPPTPAFCLIDSLKVDDSYQRSIEGGASQTLIRKIAESWDYRLCLPLIVSRRGGDLYVIDGQHRLEAAKLRGDIRDIPVVIFDFQDAKAEAELFVAANRSRRPMSQLDDFHAAVAAGDKKALAVNTVVIAAGLTVGRVVAWQYWQPREITCVKAVQRLLVSAGRDVVEQALGMIARAFDGAILVGVGAIFCGLVSLIQERAADGVPIEPGLMETVLAEVGIPGWKEATTSAESSTERADAMLRALAAAYVEAEAE